MTTWMPRPRCCYKTSDNGGLDWMHCAIPAEFVWNDRAYCPVHYPQDAGSPRPQPVKVEPPRSRPSILDQVLVAVAFVLIPTWFWQGD